MAIKIDDVAKLDPKAQNSVIGNEKRKAELGLLGVVFGNADQAKFNITGFLVVLIVLALVVCLVIAFCKEKDCQVLLNGLMTTLSAALGYMYGKKAG